MRTKQIIGWILIAPLPLIVLGIIFANFGWLGLSGFGAIVAAFVGGCLVMD